MAAPNIDSTTTFVPTTDCARHEQQGMGVQMSGRGQDTHSHTLQRPRRYLYTAKRLQWLLWGKLHIGNVHCWQLFRGDLVAGLDHGIVFAPQVILLHSSLHGSHCWSVYGCASIASSYILTTPVFFFSSKGHITALDTRQHGRRVTTSTQEQTPTTTLETHSWAPAQQQ